MTREELNELEAGREFQCRMGECMLPMLDKQIAHLEKVASDAKDKGWVDVYKNVMAEIAFHKETVSLI